MRRSIIEEIVFDPQIVKTELEILPEDFSDFYPKKYRHRYIDLAYASRDRNGLGLLLDDYRCKCGYITTNSFVYNRKPNRCGRCHRRLK